MTYRMQSDANAVSGVASGTQAVATSGFLQNNGNIVGGIYSLLWCSLSIFLFIHINNSDEYTNKTAYFILPSIIILLVSIANIYYLTTKPNNIEEEHSAKSIYANITLVPIYLLIISILLMFILGRK
jgi:hypothetical protein